MFSMSECELVLLSERSRQCYADHLTPAHLWQRHQQLYSLYAD
jgi:hypothetical protein